MTDKRGARERGQRAAAIPAGAAAATILLSTPGEAPAGWLEDGDLFLAKHQDWAAKTMIEQEGLLRTAILLCKRDPHRGFTKPRPQLVMLTQPATASDEVFALAVARYSKRGEALAQLVVGEGWMRLLGSEDRTHVLALSFQHPRLGAGLATAVVTTAGSGISVGSWNRQMNEPGAEWSGFMMDLLPRGEQ